MNSVMIITASEVFVLLLQNSSVSTQLLSMVQLMRAIYLEAQVLNFFLADGEFGHIGVITLCFTRGICA